jgi:hypothetical protein
VEEDHDLADRLLLGPGGCDSAGSYRTDAVHLAQTIRLRLNDVEHLLAEGARELLGIDRANAADHSRGEVLLDALDRSELGRPKPSLTIPTRTPRASPVQGDLPGEAQRVVQA